MTSRTCGSGSGALAVSESMRAAPGRLLRAAACLERQTAPRARRPARRPAARRLPHRRSAQAPAGQAGARQAPRGAGARRRPAAVEGRRSGCRYRPSTRAAAVRGDQISRQPKLAWNIQKRGRQRGERRVGCACGGANRRHAAPDRRAMRWDRRGVRGLERTPRTSSGATDSRQAAAGQRQWRRAAPRGRPRLRRGPVSGRSKARLPLPARSARRAGAAGPGR